MTDLSARSIADVLRVAEALVAPEVVAAEIGPRLADRLGVAPPQTVDVLHCRLDVPRRADRASRARLEVGWQFAIGGTERTTDVFAIVAFDGSVASLGAGSVELADLGMVSWSFPPDPRIQGARDVIGGHDSTPASTRVVSYSPLRGCTVWHRAHDGFGAEPVECYGKAWADPAKAANALRVADAVRDTVPVPRRLAGSAERATMWTAAVAGRTLRATPSDVSATADALASTLAGVHDVDVAGLAPIATNEIVKRARNKLARLGFLAGDAELARSVETRLERAAAAMTGVEQSTTSMGDCHGGQFVVGDDEVIVVDLDSFATCARERDLAEFVASILDGPDRWGGGADEFAATMLRGYERVSASQVDRSRFECLLLAERIARIYRIAQSLTPGWRDDVTTALDALVNERRVL
jgi:hypothetical protein